jgi:hypothetical protein
MQVVPIVNCVEEIAGVAMLRTSTIRCYLYPPLTAAALRPRLSPDRELTVQAMTLLMRVDAELQEARADWNEDRFRRLMRLRPRAVRRLRRRWETLNPKPLIPLGNLRRRYHSNLARYLFV